MFEKVYEITRLIPSGKVATYSLIARLVGTKDSRRIGHALHANKDRSIPCHRVVFADGSLASGYVFGGPLEQKKKLLAEGVEFVGDKVYNECILKERWK